jgi:hypothetical protein
VLASVIVILEYLRRRVLGLAPFADDGSEQFVAPVEMVKPRRSIGIRTQKKRK